MPPSPPCAAAFAATPGTHADGRNQDSTAAAPLDLPTPLSRRDALLLLATSALTPRRGPEKFSAGAPTRLSDGFVIVDGWVLPAHLFGRA